MLPNFELHVPRKYDRKRWKGDGEFAVAGIPKSFSELYAETQALTRVSVFPVRGGETSVGLDERFSMGLLIIKPAEIQFGVDPESVRAAAPKRSGETISQEAGSFFETSSLPIAKIEEDTSTGGGYSPGGYVLEHSLYECFDVAGYADQDQDGIRDACEVEIAHAFRPSLAFSIGEPYPERDSYWSVRRSNSYYRALSVFYAFGYHHDGGDVGTGLYEHDGDSEFIVIAVSEFGDSWPNGRWALETITYSAHWGSFWDRTDEQLYSGTVSWADTFRGRVRVFVGESKHANYRSPSFCESRLDTCNPSVPDHDTDVNPLRNLGNVWAGHGIPLWYSTCSTSYWPTSISECFWTDGFFRGWMNDFGDSHGTGYKDMLEAYDF